MNVHHSGAIFADHASSCIDAQHQTALSAADSLRSKLGFEREAFLHGVVIQGFHTDNGMFAAKEFLDQLFDSNQTIEHSGAGAAHQNGVAERNIQTVVNMAQTMMLHATICSPDGAILAHLSPMTVDHAVWLCNRIPRQGTGLAPIEVWSQSTLMNLSDASANCHIWGCPACVL